MRLGRFKRLLDGRQIGGQGEDARNVESDRRRPANRAMAPPLRETGENDALLGRNAESDLLVHQRCGRFRQIRSHAVLVRAVGRARIPQMSYHARIAIPPLTVTGRTGACGNTYRTSSRPAAAESSAATGSKSWPSAPSPCSHTTAADTVRRRLDDNGRIELPPEHRGTHGRLSRVPGGGSCRSPGRQRERPPLPTPVAPGVVGAVARVVQGSASRLRTSPPRQEWTCPMNASMSVSE